MAVRCGGDTFSSPPYAGLTSKKGVAGNCVKVWHYDLVGVIDAPLCGSDAKQRVALMRAEVLRERVATGSLCGCAISHAVALKCAKMVFACSQAFPCAPHPTPPLPSTLPTTCALLPVGPKVLAFVLLVEKMVLSPSACGRTQSPRSRCGHFCVLGDW